MLFRRRETESWAERLRVHLWPRRSWSRSSRYVLYRLRRLSASPHAIALGFDIPLRASGDIKGTPGAMLMGPNGFFEMPDGIIRALRHAHLSPTDAEFYGVKHGDMMKLKIGGDCGITLDKMLARVDKSFKLEVHIDTDEGNACNLQPDTPVELIK